MKGWLLIWIKDGQFKCWEATRAEWIIYLCNELGDSIYVCWWRLWFNVYGMGVFTFHRKLMYVLRLVSGLFGWNCNVSIWCWMPTFLKLEITKTCLINRQLMLVIIRQKWNWYLVWKTLSWWRNDTHTIPTPWLVLFCWYCKLITGHNWHQYLKVRQMVLYESLIQV